MCIVYSFILIDPRCVLIQFEKRIMAKFFSNSLFTDDFFFLFRGIDIDYQGDSMKNSILINYYL